MAKIDIPDGINPEAWEEWIEYRAKGKKKPVTIYAAKKQFKLLIKYTFADQQIIIDQSIANDYQGLFELKGNSGGSHQQAPRQSLIERTTEQARAIWAECEAEEAHQRVVDSNDTVVPPQVEFIGRGDDGQRSLLGELPIVVPQNRTLN